MKQVKFLGLVQGPMGISKYGQWFTNLSRYVSKLVEIESDNVTIFVKPS